MELLIVTDGSENLSPLVNAAEEAGIGVALIADIADASDTARMVSPDALLFVAGSLGAIAVREMGRISMDNPLPIIVMTHDKSTESIDAAVQAGCTAYIVDCSDPSRLSTLVQVAESRFRETQRLNRELEKTRSELADRKYIDRAKGILMDTRGIPEQDAFKLLRKMAMDRNKRLGEVAEQIIAAAEVLISN